MPKYLAALFAILLAAPAAAQHHGRGGHSYAPLLQRPIKALSADDIAGLRAGRGMMLALPAELNRYPGPMHVLEHAAALGLNAAQKQAIERQMADMRAEAMALGERIIAGEEALEKLFLSAGADAAAVDRLTAELGALWGKLRATHLAAHVATRAVLSDAQIAQYQKLRGYEAGTHRH
jgi:hypothetical protein